MTELSRQSRILGGLWGAIIGDALGVPVEFMNREQVRRNPITGMRGYGTFNLPPGSWSDDSSLILYFRKQDLYRHQIPQALEFLR